MTGPIQPASVPADGYLGVLWVPSLANPLSPTAAELTAVSVVDISCYITGGGYQNAVDEASIQDPRLCSRQTLERPGKFNHSLSLMYVFNPAAPTQNKAYLALTYLTTGFVVARYGVPFDNPWVAGNTVDTNPVQCGQRVKAPTEENSVLKVNQKLYIIGTVGADVVVV